TSAQGVSFKVVTTPAAQLPNANIIINKHGKDVFMPKKLTCIQMGTNNCMTITNQTPDNQDIYLNGNFFFTLSPNQAASISYPSNGRYVFTIPNSNHAA